MQSHTIFSFGYYGWGNSTPQLVQASDAVELNRGFRPPVFVDIRIRRAVRAPGFNGKAFGQLLGDDRYRWMKSLGNRHIETRTGPRIQIAEPNAVNQLIDLAMAVAEDQQRVIFFCGCEWPRIKGRVSCHRTTVASLTLRAAQRRGLPMEIVEWPGGEPAALDLQVDERSYKELLRGKLHIPAGNRSLGVSAGVAWGSVAAIHADGQPVHAVIGPARYRQGGWRHPVFSWSDNLAEIQQEAVNIRKAFGLQPVVGKRKGSE